MLFLVGGIILHDADASASHDDTSCGRRAACRAARRFCSAAFASRDGSVRTACRRWQRPTKRSRRFEPCQSFTSEAERIAPVLDAPHGVVTAAVRREIAGGVLWCRRVHRVRRCRRGALGGGGQLARRRATPGALVSFLLYAITVARPWGSWRRCSGATRRRSARQRGSSSFSRYRADRRRTFATTSARRSRAG